jgi:hypothetical protein
VALAISKVREIVERVFALPDILDAGARRDLGTIITILSSHGVAQGRIADLTGISQGRPSEWTTHKWAPQATSSFEAFANGLGVPPTARQALGLAPRPPAAGRACGALSSARRPAGGDMARRLAARCRLARRGSPRWGWPTSAAWTRCGTSSRR